MLAVLTGLSAGCLHVLSGPDHLAAVAPLAVRGHRRAWFEGVRWGLGHSAGVLLVGVLALALREVLPVAAISSWSERAVGVLLIGIGLWSLRQALRIQVHAHRHVHDGAPHEHLHFHAPRMAHAHPPAESAEPSSAGLASHGHPHAAFGIGTLHGLAGSSHLLGILPSLALPTLSQSVAYLTAFAVGTVVAMAGFSAALGLASVALGSESRAAYRSLMMTCAAAALVVGGWWLVHGG